MLLIPTKKVAFALDHIIQRRQVAKVTADIIPLGLKRHSPLTQFILFSFCVLAAVFCIYQVTIVTYEQDHIDGYLFLWA